MRYNIRKKNSSKTERLFYEVLKEKKIPFKHRWIIHGREVDFLINKYIIEIDGHDQDRKKNNELTYLGYTPIHLSNNEITRENINKLIINYNEFN